jgi:hypothetical protein
MKFEAGKTYYTRSACDYDCIFSNTIVSRTDKTVTLDNGKRCGVKVTGDGVEMIYPKGRYSMAPVYMADKIAA